MRISGLKVQPAAFSISRCPVAKADPRLSRSLDPSDNPYTKEASVEHQYLASFGSVSLSDILSGKAQMKLPDPSRANLEKYSEKLEAKGLESGIDWNAVQDIDLVGISADETEKIGDKIDYIASRYAVLKDRVASNCPLEQQKEQMAKLDSLFSETEKRIADSYAEAVGGFFEKCGITGETEKLRAGVLQNINSRIGEYSDYIRKNRGFAAVGSKSPQWLLSDDSYLAAQLRRKASGASAVQNSAGYSLRDLEAAGVYAKQATAAFQMVNPNPDSGRNEEALGLDMAMQAMKTDYLAKSSGVSNGMGSLLNRAFGGLMGKYIDFCSNSLEQCENSGVIDARQLYAPLNRSAVCKVYEKTMEQYRKSGDILDALAHGEQYAEQQYSQKTHSKDYNTMERYKSGSGFNNFFQAPKQWNPDYDVCMSDFQKYRLSIDFFVNAVKSGNTSKIDFMFGTSGGLSIDNITPNNLFRYSQNPDWEDFG